MKNFHSIKLGEVIEIKVGDTEHIFHLGVYGCYQGAGSSEDFPQYLKQAALGMFEGSESTNVYEIVNVRVIIKANDKGGLQLGNYYFETEFIEPGYDTNPNVIENLITGRKKLLEHIYHSLMD